jgi:hypothetical protein
MVLDTMRLVTTDVRGGVFEGYGRYMPEEGHVQSPSRSSGS